MNATSASRAEDQARVASGKKILVWDLPVRIFHWLMVVSFAGAYLTAESERWRLVHVTLGYTMAGLVAFRVVWGFAGTRHARFANFLRGPAGVTRYVRAMLRGEPEHFTGHNPVGALAILALLGLAAAISATGWASFNDIGGDWLGELHELAANTMLVLAGIHVAGVLLASRMHHENLVLAMGTGRKSGHPDDGVSSAWRALGALMIVAVFGFWWLQWHNAPSGSPSGAPPSAQVKAQDKDDD